MNLRADATFKAGDFARIEALIVPKLVEGVTAATKAVFDVSQELVPVDTGELKGSGSTSVEWHGTKVTGTVQYDAVHAAYQEFGTGARGAASPGAGPFPYDQNWPGVPAQPYIRPALDQSHGAVLDAIKDALK